jgi:hypothetical protein
MQEAEVQAVSDLLDQANKFASQLQDGWCISSTELDLFRRKVSALRERQVQSSNLFQGHGRFDGRLLDGLEVIVDCLGKQERYAKRLRKISCLRWRKTKVPSDLSRALSNTVEILSGTPLLLTDRAALFDLMERCREQKTLALPFGSDET